jgi:hypothetical protein
MNPRPDHDQYVNGDRYNATAPEAGRHRPDGRRLLRQQNPNMHLVSRPNAGASVRILDSWRASTPYQPRESRHISSSPPLSAGGQYPGTRLRSATYTGRRRGNRGGMRAVRTSTSYPSGVAVFDRPGEPRHQNGVANDRARWPAQRAMRCNGWPAVAPEEFCRRAEVSQAGRRNRLRGGITFAT